MACAHLLLHSSALPHAVLPLLSRRAASLPSHARNSSRFLSVSRLFSNSASERAPVMEVSAPRARRGASTEQAEIASSSDLQFEAPLKIVEYPDPILRARNKRIATFDENLKKLVDEMFDVMYKTDGIGLSAPQVGINVQLLVFNAAGERGVGEELVLINPKIQKFSQKIVLFNEGCLSFPGIYADVERPVSLKIEARDIMGSRFSISLSELPARVFQHEFDHLQGILFVDRMTEEVLGTIRLELQALEKKYETKSGLPSPERVDNIKRRKSGLGFGRKEAVGFGRP